jgi:drug/metabolite transporter (DMT)-like permease
MFTSHIGEFAALATAIFWTITALSFATASRLIGSLKVNLIRLVLAFLFLGIFTFFSRGMFFPSDANAHNWIWLSLSGLVGFVLGDLFLFRSYMVISPRISMVIMALAPPIAALTGWLFLEEKMNVKSIIGMLITLTGIALVVLERKDNEIEESGLYPKGKGNLKLKYPISGLLLAFGGAAGQGFGIVLSKYGMQGYDAFASTQIRVLTGIAGFMAMFVISGRWKTFFVSLNNKKGLVHLTIGSLFGPFLGVAFSLIAVAHTSSGIASTIMAIVPVLIIIPSVLFFKEKTTLKEIIGAVISVVGIGFFFL